MFHTTDMDGVSEINPPVTALRRLLATLDAPDSSDEDHPDVSLVHDPSGWSISVFPSGIATFENLDDEDQPPQYMAELSRETCLQLWLELSRGEIDRLKDRPWLDQ